MSTDLSIPGFGNLDLIKTQFELTRYMDEEGTGDIAREGMRHIAAERVQAAKTITAVELAGEVHKRAQVEAFKFTRDVSRRVQKVAHGEDHNGHYPQLATDLTAMYSEHVKGIVQVGVTNIAREVAKDVDLPKPKEEKKRRWFWQ